MTVNQLTMIWLVGGTTLGIGVQELPVGSAELCENLLLRFAPL